VPNSNWSSARFHDTTIKKGVFHGKVGDSAQLRRRVNEIRDNDFSRAELDDVDFRGGIDLTQQRLPTGEDYLFIKDTCKAATIVRESQSSIVDKQALERSQTLAGLLDYYCSNGQQMQLLSESAFGPFDQHLRSRLSG